MARQLRAMGREVRTLVLFGTMSPTALKPHNRARAAVAQWSADRLRGARALAGLSVRDGVSKLVEPMRAIVSDGGLADAPPADDFTARRLRVEAAALAAANQYRPEPYDGGLTLFLANEADQRSTGSAARVGGLRPGRDGRVLRSRRLRRRLDVEGRLGRRVRGAARHTP